MCLWWLVRIEQDDSWRWVFFDKLGSWTEINAQRCSKEVCVCVCVCVWKAIRKEKIGSTSSLESAF